MTSRIGTRIALLAALLSGTHILLADNVQANSLLQQGRVEEAATMLQATLTAQPNDSAAHLLLCRVFYAQELADQAIPECEKAAAAAPNDSNAQLWLGRAYGMKASHASPFTALGFAKKVHIAFERALEIDPSNTAAMDDLGEFYVDAPGMVGGGVDKAQALAEKMKSGNPARYHRLLALIAEKKKDIPAAENEYKAATSSGTPVAWVDLGHFYQRQNQNDKVLPALQSAIDADHRHDNSIVDVASILTSAHLSPELAEKLFREYLSSPAKSDAAPAFRVHLQLGRLLAANGDAAGAKREYAAALALAPNYAPARKAAQGS